MSKDDNESKNKYEIGYGKPPRNTRFGSEGGNPINKKGRPTNIERADRITTSMARNLILEEVATEVDVIENGQRNRLSKYKVIISRLVNAAVKGDAKATKQVLDAVTAAAKTSDADEHAAIQAWLDMQEYKLQGSRNPGSLEHYDTMYNWFMFKKEIRIVEGPDAWPYEPGEPKTAEEWQYFLNHRENMRDDRNAPEIWPLVYPPKKTAGEGGGGQ